MVELTPKERNALHQYCVKNMVEAREAAQDARQRGHTIVEGQYRRDYRFWATVEAKLKQ